MLAKIVKQDPLKNIEAVAISSLFFVIVVYDA